MRFLGIHRIIRSFARWYRRNYAGFTCLAARAAREGRRRVGAEPGLSMLRFSADCNVVPAGTLRLYHGPGRIGPILLDLVVRNGADSGVLAGADDAVSFVAGRRYVGRWLRNARARL